MSTSPKTFGQRLRHARKQAHLTQRKLAEMAGVDSVTVWRHEQDRMHLSSVDTLRAYARVLGVSQDWLIGAEHATSASPSALPEVMFDMLSGHRYGEISPDEKPYLLTCVRAWPDIEPDHLGAQLLFKRLVDDVGPTRARDVLELDKEWRNVQVSVSYFRKNLRNG